MQIVPQPADTAATVPDTTSAGITLQDAVAVRDALLDQAFWLGLVEMVVKVSLAVGLALLTIGLVTRLKSRWVASVVDNPATDKRRQRVLTTADLLGSVARYVIWSITIVSVLAILGFDIRALLAGAGIAGLAIGFGAQTLVKDVISGFFLLFDDTLGNGDLIRIGSDVGTVEYVGLRLIKVRKFDGELLMVPAGELRTFGNKSVGYARAIVEVGLSYEQDASVALGVLEEVASDWAETDDAKAVIVEEAPQVQAILALADSAVTARIIVQVRPGEQFAVERELRQRIKAMFDQRGIEIPFPRRTVYVKPLDGGTSEDAAAALSGE